MWKRTVFPGGKIEINYGSREEFERIMELIENGHVKQTVYFIQSEKQKRTPAYAATVKV